MDLIETGSGAGEGRKIMIGTKYNTMGRQALVVLAGLGLACSAGAASAQNKELSDKSVQVLMNYAWVMTPAKFTTPEGEVIEVDKNKRKDVEVPIETARDVVRTARLTAHASICQLDEEQGINYQTMMKREIAKNKWSKQQTLYISQLHLFTTMFMTGKIIITEKDADKEVVVPDTKLAKVATCTDTERAKVKELITAYVNSGTAKN
jgi:hypothetical protein